MQVNRRALAQRGGSRQLNPAMRAGRTVWDEMSPVVAPLLAGIDSGAVEVIDPVMPRGDSSQDALFDNTVVLDAQRQPLDLQHASRVRLAEYIRGLGMSGPLPLPLDPSRCERLVQEAESQDAAFMAEATRRAQSHVSEDLVEQVVAYARRAWLTMSVSRMREAIPATVEDAHPDPSLFAPDGLVPRQ